MNQFDQWNRKIRTIWYCSSLYMEYKNAMRKSKKMSIDKKTEYWEKKHEEFATKMLNNIYELKGWWVKVGQFLSTQENIMPSAYIEKFTNLQNMMPTSSYEKIEVILQKELGELKDLFEYIDRTPLASASIGQVHRAKILRRNNSRTPIDDYNVIIKIQHEGIDHFLSSDIATLKNVSWAFGLIDKSFYFNDFIDEWQDSAALELDYKYELFHQILAYNTFKKSQIPIKIPKIYCAYTTTKVLVMEYIKGFKITDLHLLNKYNVDKYKLVYSIIDYFAYQIHNDGFFHGDPHPGNILVLVKQKEKRKKKKSKLTKKKKEKKKKIKTIGETLSIEKNIKKEIECNRRKKSNSVKYESDNNIEDLKKNSFIRSVKLRSIEEETGKTDKREKTEKLEIKEESEKTEENFQNGINRSLLKSHIYDSHFFGDDLDQQFLKKRSFKSKYCFSDDLNFIRHETSKVTEGFQSSYDSSGAKKKEMDNNWSEINVTKMKTKAELLNWDFSENEKKTKKEMKIVEKKTNTFLRNPFPFSLKTEKKTKRNEKKVQKKKYICTPVIIDWGLIKQLDTVMQLAFCKLIYNISCMNVLNVIEAFEDMGFCFKEDFTYDPEIYIENLKMFFLKKLEESNKMTESAKEQDDKNNSNSKGGVEGGGKMNKMEMLQNVDKNEVLDKNPISDVPKDIIFFIRVASLLHGLCSQLNVKVNYLSIFAKRAKEALENIYTPISKSIYTIPIDKMPNSFVEKRIHKYLKTLYAQNKILGCQIAIIHKKKLVANTCVGVTSNTDKRPITKHSLFNGYCLNKCVLTVALLHLITNAVNEQQSFENESSIYNKFTKFLQKEIRKNEKNKKQRKKDEEKEKEKEREREREREKSENTKDNQNDRENVTIRNHTNINNEKDTVMLVERQNVQQKFIFDERERNTHRDTVVHNSSLKEESRCSKIKTSRVCSENKPCYKVHNVPNTSHMTTDMCGISRRILTGSVRENVSSRNISSEGNYITEGKSLGNSTKQEMDITNQRIITNETRAEREEARNALLEKLKKYIEGKQINNFKMTINDNICNYWDGFISKNKKHIRIKDLLTQKCFLEKPFHDKITLSKFIDYDKMISMIENARNYKQRNESRKHGKYLYLIYAYIVAELIHNISGLKYHDYIYKYIVKPLHLKNEMFIPIPSSFLKKTEKEQEKEQVPAKKGEGKGKGIDKKSIDEKGINRKGTDKKGIDKKGIDKKGIDKKGIEQKEKTVSQSNFVSNKQWDYLAVPSFSSKVNEDLEQKKRGRSSPQSQDETMVNNLDDELEKGKRGISNMRDVRDLHEKWNGNIIGSDHKRNTDDNGYARNINNMGIKKTRNMRNMRNMRNTSFDVNLSGKKETVATEQMRNASYKEENEVLQKMNESVIEEKYFGEKGKTETGINNSLHSNRDLLYQYNVWDGVKEKRNTPKKHCVEAKDKKSVSQSTTRSNVTSTDKNLFSAEEKKKRHSQESSSNKIGNTATKNKKGTNLRNTFLNHVGSIKEKTKQINYSIKNMYENNENTFFKKIFLKQRSFSNNEEHMLNRKAENGTLKKSEHNKDAFDISNATKKKSYLEGFIKKRKERKNSSMNRRMENKIRTQHNIVGDNNVCETKDIGAFVSNNVNLLMYNNKKTQTDSDVETGTETWTGNEMDSKVKKMRSISLCPALNFPMDKTVFSDLNMCISLSNAASICSKQKLLFDKYNLDACSCLPVKEQVLPIYENSTDDYIMYNTETNKEKSFHSFMENDNIKMLFRNLDTKSSGEESVNSLLEKKFHRYHRKSKKYKQFFQYLKDLKRGLSQNPRTSNNCVSQKEIEKTERKKTGKEKNIKENTDPTCNHEISDEELMQKLIEYKYYILKKQKAQTMEKKNKSNIYSNEHSDDIEMFSDTEDSENDNNSSCTSNSNSVSVSNSNSNNNSIRSNTQQSYRKTVFKKKGRLKTKMKKNGKKQNKNEQVFVNEKKKQLEIYLIMNNLYQKKKKCLISAENHTINKHTDLFWRLAFARRTINIVDSISKTDVTKKFENFNNNLKSKKKEVPKDGAFSGNRSSLKNEEEKIIHDVKQIDEKIKVYVENFNAKTYNKYISIFQLAKEKPYILDPLIYDSKKILDKFIPINGRFTAKAMCKLFAFINNQFFFPKYVLNKIRKEYTKDNSVESFLLTAGMSRAWGLGFQLFECEYDGEINEDFYLVARDEKKKKKKKKEEKKKRKKQRTSGMFSLSQRYDTPVLNKMKNKKSRTIVGYGQSDISGCLALSFPEIDFSLTILLSDIFKGPEVSHLILEYILQIYGIKPKWKSPIPISEIIKVF